jgi:hypothetical protein
MMPVRVRILIALALGLGYFIFTFTLGPNRSALTRGKFDSDKRRQSGEEGSLLAFDNINEEQQLETLPASRKLPHEELHEHHGPAVIDPSKSALEITDSSNHELKSVESLSSSPHPHDHIPTVDDFRLLIGVMSPFRKSARRHIIRNAYSRFPPGLPVDVIFVQGTVPSAHDWNLEKKLAMQRTAMDWENSTFNDIMLLDCEENLEEGKTYEYLKKVGLEFSRQYTHVMKTDDDSFVNIPGILFNCETLTFSSAG